MKKILLALLALCLLTGCTPEIPVPETPTATLPETPAVPQSTQTPQQDTPSVYYLNRDPQLADAWETLAQTYTAQTGVPVTVSTPADGTYSLAMDAQMGKSAMPTVFQLSGLSQLEQWQDYCLDLTNTTLHEQLLSDDFALISGGSVYGVGCAMESYGLIVNTRLLASAGFSVSSINSFADLKKVAESITARKNELGFSAFASSGMSAHPGQPLTTWLANLPVAFEYQSRNLYTAKTLEGTYLQNFHNFWDLYINNAASAPDTLSGKTAADAAAEFTSGQAVFYLNSARAYTELAAMGENSLAMIPLYFGIGDEENQGLCTDTQSYWCINSWADEADIQASLNFLNWCVTSNEAANVLAVEMGVSLPYQSARKTSNSFAQQASQMLDLGCQPVQWTFSTMPSEIWKTDLNSALFAYAAGNSDWSAVETVFLDGWASGFSR